MWARADGLTDHELTAFTIKDDLVLVRFRAFLGNLGSSTVHSYKGTKRLDRLWHYYTWQDQDPCR
jgi:hypothetical protein